MKKANKRPPRAQRDSDSIPQHVCRCGLSFNSAYQLKQHKDYCDA